MFLFFVIAQQISAQAEKDACLNIISFIFAQKTIIINIINGTRY